MPGKAAVGSGSDQRADLCRGNSQRLPAEETGGRPDSAAGIPNQNKIKKLPCRRFKGCVPACLVNPEFRIHGKRAKAWSFYFG